MLLTSLAAGAGLLLIAYWASRFASQVQPTQLAATDLPRSWIGGCWAFAVGIAALTGLLFGVLPASLIGRMQARPGAAGTGVHRMRGALLAMQAAFTVVLVAGSMSMTRSLAEVDAHGPGDADRSRDHAAHVADGKPDRRAGAQGAVLSGSAAADAGDPGGGIGGRSGIPAAPAEFLRRLGLPPGYGQKRRPAYRWRPRRIIFEPPESGCWTGGNSPTRTATVRQRWPS